MPFVSRLLVSFVSEELDMQLPDIIFQSLRVLNVGSYYQWIEKHRQYYLQSVVLSDNSTLLENRQLKPLHQPRTKFSRSRELIISDAIRTSCSFD
ncbi:unnamed protein product [Linum tenue]|uniref:Maturase K n=1 Tax=Linum tenue TaxID=586396 RepID=A0AAV0I1I1_9ROSI|nr:unnamed protein product [Linum tenue]